MTSLAQLWRLSREDLQAAVTGATGEQCTLADVTVAAPVDGRTEVWACGVTYEISREARTEESERSPDVYRQVLTTGVVPGPEAMSWLVDVTGAPGQETPGHLAPATDREAL